MNLEVQVLSYAEKEAKNGCAFQLSLFIVVPSLKGKICPLENDIMLRRPFERGMTTVRDS